VPFCTRINHAAIIEVLVKAEHDFYREKWQKRIEREKGHLTSL
jgi:hypothetical protein